jgi:hypothetical protein
MRQAIDLSDARWRSDVERLIRELEGDAAPEQLRLRGHRLIFRASGTACNTARPRAC